MFVPTLLDLATNEIREYERQRTTNRAWGEFLDEYSWDYFVTLTYEREPTLAAATRHYKEWIRRLERSAGQYIPHFVGYEHGTAHGRLHLHTLVSGTAGLSPSLMDDAWGYGRTLVLPYMPGRGASYYVAKRVGQEFFEYDISKRLPSRQADSI